MKRKIKKYDLPDQQIFISKLTHWLYYQNYFTFFNGNGFDFPYGPFPTFAAAGTVSELDFIREDPFTELKDFREKHHDWLIGRFNYDLKNFIEKLSSVHIDRIAFPDLHFFVPVSLIFIYSEHVEIQSLENPDTIWNEIQDIKFERKKNHFDTVLCDTSPDDYQLNVEKIKHQILEGDFYELNYCLEYYARSADIHPPDIYTRLNELSPMPFSLFQGMGDHIMISASPERFLKKAGDLLIAQPIKGTIRRDSDPVSDKRLQHQLKNSEKEIAENMMIVDLMRNDLGKSAIPGTVKVPELFQIYSFRHLHQMISTITCLKRKEVDLFQAIRDAFPMGSMTGAPKIRVMQEIEHYESSKRGPYSGAAGFITPEGDFDFNVLIRSLFYNRKNQFFKFNVGSAITFDADPNDEYQECLLKAKAILEVLDQPANHT